MELNNQVNQMNDKEWFELMKAEGLVNENIKPAITMVGDDPNKKVYLILSTEPENEDGTGSMTQWFISIGRQVTYEYLRDLISANAIDPTTSFILSGHIDLEKAITVYRFMKSMVEQGKVLETTGFDIDEDGVVEEDFTILEV